MGNTDTRIEAGFRYATELYGELGVDVGRAMERLATVRLSLHCWQGDDVRGFEGRAGEIGGGLSVTGSYPGRARTPDELRQDLDHAFSHLPGRHRLNLHASYGEFGGRTVERDAIDASHFAGWIDWARRGDHGLDFNPTFFSHPLAETATLSHADAGIRGFWVRHGQVCRQIAAAMGRATGSASVCNVWIPDGSKDTPADRFGPRQRLEHSLDEVFAAPIAPSAVLDSVEPKLFGIGSESYVVGSHEFYLGYAVRRRKLLCLDTGHFHPTESVADKISAVLLSLDRVLLHVSRGVRWDSDHVVTLGDDLSAVAAELVRGDVLSRVHLGLDYFDASINRVAAWVIGARNLLYALLAALLEPTERLKEAEAAGNLTARLALMEECKTLPAAAVWDYYCLKSSVAPAGRWLDRVRQYESNVLAQRS